MIKQSDLNQNRSKEVYELQEKTFVIQKYLFLGNKVVYENRTYRMDGDLNLYIVCFDENGNELDNWPIVANEDAYRLFIDMAEHIEDNYYNDMKFAVVSAKMINGLK